MKNLGASVLLFVFVCSGMAQAAEFLVLDIDADPNVATMTLTDSSAIAAGEPGHKLVTLLYVHEGADWDERKMELDCTAPRWRELGGVRHHLDGSTADEQPDAGWSAIEDGTSGANIRGAVCAWPDQKPGADKIASGALQDVITQGAVVMRRMAAESQRERDDDK